jgi:hypothetical protein
MNFSEPDGFFDPDGFGEKTAYRATISFPSRAGNQMRYIYTFIE